MPDFFALSHFEVLEFVLGGITSDGDPAPTQTGADAVADSGGRRKMDGVRGEMKLTVLPKRAGQNDLADRALPGMVVAGDRSNATQAAVN